MIYKGMVVCAILIKNFALYNEKTSHRKHWEKPPFYVKNRIEDVFPPESLGVEWGYWNPLVNEIVNMFVIFNPAVYNLFKIALKHAIFF